MPMMLTKGNSGQRRERMASRGSVGRFRRFKRTIGRVPSGSPGESLTGEMKIEPACPPRSLGIVAAETKTAKKGHSHSGLSSAFVTQTGKAR